MNTFRSHFPFLQILAVLVINVLLAPNLIHCSLLNDFFDPWVLQRYLLPLLRYHLLTVCANEVIIICNHSMFFQILKLGRSGLTKTEPGQVINLMSNDVNRFDLASQFLNFLWVMPVVIPVVSVLVWQNIGIATLAALAVIFLQTILVQGNFYSPNFLLH